MKEKKENKNKGIKNLESIKRDVIRDFLVSMENVRE